MNVITRARGTKLATALLATTAAGFLLVGCASPGPAATVISAASAQLEATHITQAPPVVTVTQAPVTEAQAPDTVIQAPGSAIVAPTTAFNPNGAAQYVGRWTETWNHGTSASTQTDRFVVTQSSGGNLSIDCISDDYIVSQINPLGGSLTFHTSCPASSEYVSEIDYTLHRSGNSLVGTATLSVWDTGTVDVSWAPSS